ncbi:unnamed protein product [Hymenolepis diminuta]|uniref:Cyclic nucleotide-binding domain-containing protein n=1 Tax=Hymenolepis diminuta TaxID=6216 RepID=A0A564YZN6_HYMDI|nr:unnamed protein product [Hymenolepis diminuta]
MASLVGIGWESCSWKSSDWFPLGDAGLGTHGGNSDQIWQFWERPQEGASSIPEVIIERAIQSYPNSTLSRTTDQSRRPIQPLLRSNLPESRLSAGIESRLRELRQSFSQRTELVKKREFVVKEEEKSESSEEETGDLQTTTSAEGQLDIGYTVEEEKYSLWHNPPRSLYIRRPPCFIDTSPYKVPFLKAEDTRLYYVAIDDGGDLAPKPTEAEFLGLSTNVPTTWKVILPSWLPTPKEFINVTIEPNGKMLPVIIEFFDRADLRVSIGFAFRLTKIMVYLIYVIHVESCGYYAFNRFHGLNASDWSIGNNNNNNPYIYSFYVATKMATSIGNLPHATNPPEFIFMTVYWLTGVYVSAILIGQVIDILDSQSAEKEAYKKRMSATLTYLKRIKAPERDIDMVRTWFNHNWNQQKTLDENMLIDALPLKLEQDVLIDVHYQTLSKGEVGLEMYIVKQGFVEVVGGPDNSIVFVTLKEGSVFGEISLLAIKGKNIRTATVRSKGYSTLFRLTKSDFEEAMKNYPAAYKLLKRKAQKMLQKDKKKEEEEAKAKAKEEKEKEELERTGSMEIIPDHRRLSTMPMVVDQVIERKKSMLLQKAIKLKIDLDDEATLNLDLSSLPDESVADMDSEKEFPEELTHLASP